MTDANLTSPGFGPRLQDLARRLGVAGFWPWWTQQLATLVPAAPRAAMARRRMRPVLVFDGEHATLWRPAVDQQRAVMRQVAHIPLTGDAVAVAAAGRAALAPLARMKYSGATAPVRLVIALRPRDVLRRKIILPLAVEENLRQALGYDLDRHTPFKPEELYFDAVTLERDAARATITVDLAAVRRPLVDPLLKHAAAWGGDVAAVVPESPQGAAASRLNLLPLAARNRPALWSRWQFWLPLALFVVLVFAAVLIPLWQSRDYAISLNAIVDQARAQAAVSEKLREELDARVGDYNVVLGKKYAFPGALQVVDNVSKLLPDDTWLTQFELKSVAKGKEVQRELLVRGETANAGRLVQLFEESQLFAQAAPRSQTTKIQPGPGEIFDLGAQLKPLPAPPRLPLVVGAADTGAPTAAPAGAPGTAAAAPAPATTTTTATVPAPAMPADSVTPPPDSPPPTPVSANKARSADGPAPGAAPAPPPAAGRPAPPGKAKP